MSMVSADFLVIGSGIAGLSFALEAAKYWRIALVTKHNLKEGSTNYAQGGIASVFGIEDSFDMHIKDTLDAGDGLCHTDIVKIVVEEGPDRIKELMNLGVNFSMKSGGDALDLGREGGHSNRRIVHTKDHTGAEVEKVLLNRILENKNIDIFENHMAVDLITTSTEVKHGMLGAENKKTCKGAYVLESETGEIKIFLAKVTVLATGGAGKVYLYTSNPDTATGDGIAVGYRAGADVANMEFVQFHPTCLYHPKAKNFLISEAVRGEGAVLINKQGMRFMESYHPMKELACRDVVARSIDMELKKSGEGCVYLDISYKPYDFITDRFPHIYETCMHYGIDISREPIPVVPAAHYMCGGLVTNEYGMTGLENLYAIGEVACTGLHGANRLASNSLLEALVFAKRTACYASNQIKSITERRTQPVPSWNVGDATDSEEAVVIYNNWEEIRRFMWNYVGIVRTNKRLSRAMSRIRIIQDEIREYYWNFLVTRDLLELRNLALVAELIIKCSLVRYESRGLHYNLDYPEKSASWQKDTIIRQYN